MMAEFLTVEEIARLFHIHEMTVRRHIQRGKLKAVKVGGRIRVRREEVERFMQPVPTRLTITIPPPELPSRAEIARRRALFDEAMRLRQIVGPIGMTSDELVRRGRLEEEPPDA